MNLTELKAFIEQGESGTLEFKKSTARLHSAIETVCAFLNNKGGTVLIGVNDNGQIVGQGVSDRTRQEIATEINKIEPTAPIEISYIPIEKNKFVIVIHVLPGNHVPYIYDARPYQRHESTTVRMTQHRYEQLLIKRGQLNHAWEKCIANDYVLSDLDRNLILGVIRKSVETKRLPEEALRQDISQVLEALQLYKDDFLVNAAVVLFGTKFMPNYPQCQLKMARFKGTNRHEFLDSDLVYGNIFELLEKGTMFVKRHIPVAARVSSDRLERIETPLIPFDAIREALLNALCHKDYSIYSGSVGMAIYDDRMEIFNNGGLPPGVTIEKIKQGFSTPRNQLIAEVLFRSNLIEKWGRGIQEMIRSCMTAGDPEPEFISDQVEFKVIFKFPEERKHEETVLTIPQVQLTKRQREIVEILSKTNDLNINNILSHIQDKTSERSLRRDLAKLRDFGIVQMHGHTHAVVWSLLPPSRSPSV